MARPRRAISSTGNNSPLSAPKRALRKKFSRDELGQRAYDLGAELSDGVTENPLSGEFSGVGLSPFEVAKRLGVDPFGDEIQFLLDDFEEGWYSKVGKSSRRARMASMRRRSNVEFGEWSVKKFPDGWANSEIWTATSNVGGITGEITVSKMFGVSWSLYLPGGIVGTSGSASSTDEAIEKMKKAPEFGLAWSRSSSMRRRSSLSWQTLPNPFNGAEETYAQSGDWEFSIQFDQVNGDYRMDVIDVGTHYLTENAGSIEELKRSAEDIVDSWKESRVRPSPKKSMRRRARNVPSDALSGDVVEIVDFSNGWTVVIERDSVVGFSWSIHDDYGKYIDISEGDYGSLEEAKSDIDYVLSGFNMSLGDGSSEKTSKAKGAKIRRRSGTVKIDWHYDSGTDRKGNPYEAWTYWGFGYTAGVWKTNGFMELVITSDSSGAVVMGGGPFPVSSIEEATRIAEDWFDGFGEPNPLMDALSSRRAMRRRASSSLKFLSDGEAVEVFTDSDGKKTYYGLQFDGKTLTKSIAEDNDITTASDFRVKRDGVFSESDVSEITSNNRGANMNRMREAARRRANIRRASASRANRKVSHNGWTNWDTWNAALWINNEEGIYRAALETESPEELRELIVDWGITGDGFDVNAVNWDEVWTDSEFGTTASVRPSRRRRASMRRRAETAKEFIDRLVSNGTLSPAARDMDPQEVIDQYNEANALDAEDEDFLRLPKSSRNQRGSSMNREARIEAARRRARIAAIRRRSDSRPVAPANDLAGLGGEEATATGENLTDAIREPLNKRVHNPGADERATQVDADEYDAQGGREAPLNPEVAPANQHNLASRKPIQAMRLADLNLELGTISPDEKYAKVAEYEELPAEVLEDRVKTAEEIISKLPKQAAQKTASGRVPKPSLAPRGLPSRHSSQEDSEEPLLFL